MEQWTSAVETLKTEWTRREEHRTREADALASHQQLDDMRAVQQQREADAAAQAQLEKETKAKAEAARAEEEKRRRQDAHRLLREHEEAQRVERERVQRLVESEQRRLALEEAEEEPMRASRVALRQQHAQLRLEAQRAAAAELCSLRLQREAELQSLAATVAPLVEASTERLRAPTQASRAEGDAASALFRVDGYSDETLFSDPRAKLSAALYVAGISPGHEYAREVLQRVGAGREMRRDMKSSLTLEVERGEAGL